MSDDVARSAESQLASSQQIADDIIEQSKVAIDSLDTPALSIQLMRTWREGFGDGMGMAAQIAETMAAQEGLPVDAVAVLSALAQSIRTAEERAPRPRLPDPYPVTTVEG